MSSILLVSATSQEHNETNIYGHPIHILGIGKVNAAIKTTALINKYNPDIVINFGSCGNLKNYRKGQVLEVSKTVNDFEAYNLKGAGSDHNYPSTGFLDIREQVSCFTTDTFFDSNVTDYTLRYLDNIRECDIVDMEAYSIIESCLYAKKSVYCYKWVSDDGEPSSWNENANLGYNKFKELLHERLNKEI